MTCDSSQAGCGWTLSQILEHKLPNGRTKLIETPLQFGSKAFKGPEQRCSASERELIGLYYCIFSLKGILRFAKILLKIDCMALTSLKIGFSGRFLRQHRMIETLDSILTKHNTRVVHKKGESPSMRVADALSRLDNLTWEKIKNEILPNLEEAPQPICAVISEEITTSKNGGVKPQFPYPPHFHSTEKRSRETMEASNEPLQPTSSSTRQQHQTQMGPNQRNGASDTRTRLSRDLTQLRGPHWLPPLRCLK